MIIITENKNIKIDPELHKKLKQKALDKDKTLKLEVEDLLIKGLEADNHNE